MNKPKRWLQSRIEVYQSISIWCYMCSPIPISRLWYSTFRNAIFRFSIQSMCNVYPNICYVYLNAVVFFSSKILVWYNNSHCKKKVFENYIFGKYGGRQLSLGILKLVLWNSSLRMFKNLFLIFLSFNLKGHP